MDKSLVPVAGRTLSRAAFMLSLLLPVFPPALPLGLAATPQREAIHFDLEVLPDAKRYVELAAYPSYLAAALQNNGFASSQSGRVIIEDGRTLRFKNAVVTFVRQDKAVFHYNATVEWSIGIAQSKFELPVEADLSRVGEGKVAIRVYPPLAKLFPEELMDKIRLKVQSVANLAVQQRMLEYFDGLPGSKEGRLDTARMFERILIDAYNLPAVAPGLVGAGEPGDALPLSDQVLLLITLMIWVVAPLAWLGWRYWRGRGRRGAAR